MSKRLQVLLEEDELEALRREAERQEMTLSEWVRAVLRDARRRRPASKEAKLAAIREACTHRYPTGGIDQMLLEIERGYGGEP